MATQELFFEGKTIELAVEAAAEALGEDKDLLEYEVVVTPSRGIFGIGATLAKIMVEQQVQDTQPKKEEEVKIPAGFAPEKISKKEKTTKSAPKKEVKKAPVITQKVLSPVPEGDEVVPVIEKFVLGLLKELEIEDGKITVSLDENGSYFTVVEGSKMGVLIGRRGETLDAAQYLANLVVNRARDKKVKVILDSENYRAKRAAALETLANRTADKAIKYKRNQTLEPMDAYERRIIHASLTGRENISTYSVGTEPRRKVVIAYQK